MPLVVLFSVQTTDTGRFDVTPTYQLWFLMDSVFFHSSLLCWQCTLESQAPLVPGLLSTRDELRQVCVYKIGENNLYCCHHLPHCLRYQDHSASCLFGLLACETPDFLEGIVYKYEFSFQFKMSPSVRFSVIYELPQNNSQCISYWCNFH